MGERSGGFCYGTEYNGQTSREEILYILSKKKYRSKTASGMPGFDVMEAPDKKGTFVIGSQLSHYASAKKMPDVRELESIELGGVTMQFMCNAELLAALRKK